MGDLNTYLKLAIVISAIAATIGILLNTWIVKRRKNHTAEEASTPPISRTPYTRKTLTDLPKREEMLEAITEALPEIPEQYGQLRMIDGDPQYTWILKDGENIIGRSGAADIFLDHRGISREHTLITQSGTNFYIKDLNSKNHTFVNEIKVEGELELQDGVLIRIGYLNLQFSLVKIK